MGLPKENFLSIKGPQAQATIEFVFVFIVLVFIFYSCVKALQWMGVAMVSSKGGHYQGLYEYPLTNSSDPGANAVMQLDGAIDRAMPEMNLVYPGQIFK